MSKEFFITAVVKARPKHREQVREAMISLLKPTRKEKGCIKYDLHESLDDPNIFLFYEIWANEECLTNHINSNHIKEYREKIACMIEDRTIKRLAKIDG